LTRIPFYKDVIVSSFSCNSCGYHNSELQPGGKIQEKGVKYTVNIQNEKVYIVTCRSRDKGHVSMDKKKRQKIKGYLNCAISDFIGEFLS
jgi:C4-type Zn-finger protein